MSIPLRYAVGIDMGATNSRVALVSNRGDIIRLERERGFNKSLRNLDQRLEQVVDLYKRVLSAPESAGIDPVGIGVGMGGQITTDGWLVGHNGPRDPGFQPAPVLQMVKNKLAVDLPIAIDNDSKAAAFGEYLFGAGKGAQNVVVLTIGTGIGGGIIVNGKLLHGVSGLAGHLGFVTVDMHGPLCPAGMAGCVEYYASGTGIGRSAQQKLAESPSGSMLEMAGGRVDNVTSDIVFNAAEQGDALALEVIHRAAYALGIAIASIVHTLNPDVVVLGGGVAERGDIFLEPVRKAFSANALYKYSFTPIKVAELGDRAGVAGAAALTGFQEA